MTTQEMQKYLSNLQNDRFQTKILNVILTIYAEQKQLEGLVIELQQKVNEIISNWNVEIEGENAEALNPEIKEDSSQEDLVVEDTGSADSQEVE